MGKVITLGLQKGGVSKSTTTGILAYLLANDGKRVLVVDMDSQGNVTELLTDVTANEFIGRSIYEAVIYKDAEKYIHKVSDNLDLIPANNFLALYSRWIYTSKMIVLGEEVREEIMPYKGKAEEQLDILLDQVRDKYDYILIDTPPSLSEQTSSALVASDYIIVLYECSKFCYSAIPNFMESLEIAKEVSSHDVEVVGILRTLNDKRRSDSKVFNDAIAEDYPDLVFKTIITRKASTGRLPFYGLSDNPELNDALSQFKEFYQELVERIGE
ncbi:ParA family protein (plasmid) [Aneurinibacillus sp. Ricciae_BoGa-3]|uniref:ParA family protein n=1 Tax=Aneurinibacillus sp. Ricciae_BoGa-3 TaxID=3022697 RepID=UPI002341674E|nr:ParA family protein [Aneurinibacillus sp. Ricciae_BoGa-3]WCK57774.1 ParA family protein [Aneurinibacillus sp. Ricciae_BoGa-3]